MPKIYIKEKNKKFVINVNFNEAIKSMIYSYEYIFDKSYKYKIICKNKNIIKLEIKNHCFFKKDEIILFYKDFNKTYKILDVDDNNIIILENNFIKDGYIKLNKKKNIKNLVFNSCILDYKKQFKDYCIKENSIILCC